MHFKKIKIWNSESLLKSRDSLHKTGTDNLEPISQKFIVGDLHKTASERIGILEENVNAILGLTQEKPNP